MTLVDALALIGNLSAPSKMPCQAYNLPASRCVTGSKLAKIVGTICSQCYAMRGNYGFKNVQDCLNRRADSVNDSNWVDAMVTAILGTESSGFFRWHDSGDVQSVEHLRKIVDVCNRTPKIKHWLPTREFAFVRKFLAAGGVIPKNLCVRFSAVMIDGPTPDSAAKACGVCVSGAAREKAHKGASSLASQGGYTCPAPTQGNKCLTCRLCWNKKRFSVTYKKH